MADSCSIFPILQSILGFSDPEITNLALVLRNLHFQSWLSNKFLRLCTIYISFYTSPQFSAHFFAVFSAGYVEMRQNTCTPDGGRRGRPLVASYGRFCTLKRPLLNRMLRQRTFRPQNVVGDGCHCGTIFSTENFLSNGGDFTLIG